MYRKSFLLMLLLALVFIPAANAKTIIWVTEAQDQDNDTVNDSKVWADKLAAEGYTVDFQPGNWNDFTDAKLALVNAADLVIISATTQSSTFSGTGEVALWNSVSVPMMLCSPYIARNATAGRWQWIDYGEATLPNNNGDDGHPLMQVVIPSHPIFFGVTLEANDQLNFLDPAASTGHATFLATNNPGNGTLIAKTVQTDLVKDWSWIIEWKKGTTFYSGSSYNAANHRMYFTGIGYHEATNFPMRGYNLKDEGWKLYLNAVKYMLGDLEGPQASSPNPKDNATDVSKNTGLSWKPGIFVNTHNVFFGTDFNDVNEATVSVHDSGVTVTQGLVKDVNYLNPGKLELGQTYYWRVDEVGDSSNPGTYKGQVWSFTIEPVAIKLPKENIIKATAKSSNSGNDPINTVNENGLDPNTDLHTTQGFWGSPTGQTADDPVWIRYDFDKLYKVHEMLVWNYNQTQSWKYGFKDVLIEYSTDDGVSWTNLNTVTVFAQAPGKTNYKYNTTVPFNDVIASSVRITAISTYNPSYVKAGLSEVRFNIIPTRARIPSPETDANNIAVDKVITWRPGREVERHDVYISTDFQAMSNGSVPAHTITVNNYAPLLDFGRTYYWSVTEVNDSRTPSRWASDIWNFTTAEYGIVDDFEDYNGTPGCEIYMTWDDGLSSFTNGSQMGYNDSPYVETKIVQHGKQSAPISYDNSGEVEPSAAYSETTRIFAAPLNLTVNGADTLRLYYRGNAITFGEMPGGYMALSGEGADIYGASDEFRYAYKTLTGNGSIVARVDSIERANDWSKAGIMIRSTLDANTPHVTAVLGANGTAEYESRSIKGGSTTTLDVANLGAPCWLKITRSSDIFTIERSKDGVTWLPFGADSNTPTEVTIPMANPVYIGIVVASHSANVLASGTFSGVATSGGVSTDAWKVAAIGDIDQIEGTNTIDALYLIVEDSAGKKAKVYGPGNALGSTLWMEWVLPYSQFTNVDMSKLAKLTIGVGDAAAAAKGKGTLYIDNITYGHPIAK